jgi:hypothetical protein
MLSRLPGATLLLALLALAPTGARAASILYGDFAGATLTFQGVTESSITDGLPLYGAPTAAGDSLSFSPTFASGAAGSSDTTSGTLSITIQANPGEFLQQILVAESGVYAFTNSLAQPAAPTAQANVSGLLTVTDLANGTGVRTAVLVALPGGTFTGTGAGSEGGSWSASAAIDLTGLGLTRVRVVFNNNLQTLADAGATASIAKRQITITNTPEPTAALLLGLGLAGLGFSGRRRKE